MVKYEYKVDSIEAAITPKDIQKGVAASKITSQIELKMKELSGKGFEFYSQFPVAVTIKKGCLDRVLNLFKKEDPNDTKFNVYTLVFRREV